MTGGDNWEENEAAMIECVIRVCFRYRPIMKEIMDEHVLNNTR